MAKKGPPYDDDPDGTFLVITNPWGMKPCNKRTNADFNVLGAWVRFMFREEDTNPEEDTLVESTYSRSTEDMIIVKLPPDVDVKPYLGVHEWKKFLIPELAKEREDQKTNEKSYVFEYNYRMNGDPATHNWHEHVPTSDFPPIRFPIKVPYPPASWAERPAILKHIGLSIPPPAVVEVTINKEHTAKPAEESQIHEIVDKQDPYEAEHHAQELLGLQGAAKGELTESNALLKQEDDAYQPSEALLASLSSLQQQSLSQAGQSVQSKTELLDDKSILSGVSSSSDYTPSLGLIDAIKQHQSQTPDATTSTIKREHPADLRLPKPEPSDDQGLSGLSSMPVKYRGPHSSELQVAHNLQNRNTSGPPKRPKAEDDDFNYGPGKRKKIDRN